MRKNQSIGFYIALFVFAFSIFSIGSLVERHQSLNLLLAFIGAFAASVVIIRANASFKFLIGFGIFLRLLLFISMPSLSDDIYRFIWDGTLLKNGIHPFDHLPAHYLTENIQGINQTLYDLLNSPAYFTIYPPFNQLLFWLSALIGNGNWLVSAGIIRIFLVLADIGSLWFLAQLLDKKEKPKILAFWFFLNPLVILEFSGNLHFEGFVIFFLLAGVYYWHEKRKLLSGTGFGLAVGAKLLPLIFLPFLFLAGLRSKQWSIAIIGGVIAILSLLPMLSTSFITGMQSSIGLYFQKFEFNASIYFIAREIGFSMYGFNKIAQIGPWLSIISTISILGISILGALKKWSVPKTLLFILSTYLLFATTVHPWYILPLIVLGILSGYYFPIMWSFMIFATYLGYSEHGFQLPMTWIFTEYFVVVATLIFELSKKKWMMNSI